MIYWTSLTFFLLSCILFTIKRLLRYLRYLQQEEYSPGRFLHWVWQHRAFDRRGSLVLLLMGLCFPFFPYLSQFIGSLCIIGISLWEEDPRKKGKLRLIMTPRAQRIYFAALSVYFLMQVPALLLSQNLFWVVQIFLFQLTPLWLVVSVSLLSWDESRRQKKLILEAKQRFAETSPYVIGITGSYGKTSTKDALGNILQVALAPTFWPEKGVNTPMGITREIRTKLFPGAEYAVIEMGAYGRGSIKRLCALTPPHAGIITGIGIAHLDRFGDQQTIQRAKGELAQAIPEEGILVCNGDNPGARNIAKDNPKAQTLLYGFDNKENDLDCWISSADTTPNGSLFTLHWKETSYEGTTPLLGTPALSNIAAAFTMACALGTQPEFALAAIANLKSVNNRLELHKDEEITYLKDAYNSNPEGFASALEVLSTIPAKSRILMTPGMIELANQNYEQHEKIGRKAAQVCDLAIIVGTTNRESLTRGLQLGGMPSEKIVHTQNRDQAFQELHSHLEAGDAVLIENDLPDLFETAEKF
ncbi:MAG: UDP-N-acetylmuramoyl-tripeptide--D-alanyl-D-alanine ligase [Chlamydiae bacterium]|nr:UDP-N-acetylmuramoyl-tripeptide--D-alanyl-D-alanine ligase [Chlamydiota bacterium]